jgi:hypothetical protein
MKREFIIILFRLYAASSSKMPKKIMDGWFNRFLPAVNAVLRAPQ